MRRAGTRTSGVQNTMYLHHARPPARRPNHMNSRENVILRIGTGVALSKGMSVTPENALPPDLAVKASLSCVTFGSCRCGDVGYRITGQPLRSVRCQCESCSGERDATRAPSLFVPARLFSWTRGESQIVSYRLPGPRAYSTAYCRRCGADVPRASRGVVVVPPLAAADPLSPYVEMPPVADPASAQDPMRSGSP
jgi:hypothetical protein